MSHHLYWRLYITASQGNGDPNKAHWHEWAEVELRATPGGADQCTGGTATAHDEYSQTYGAAKAFDNDTGTFWGSYSANVVPGWIRYQFASAVTVAEVAITSRNPAQNDYAPKDFQLQWSDNGTTWTMAGIWSGLPSWDHGETRIFRLPLAVAQRHRYDMPVPTAQNQVRQPYGLTLTRAQTRIWDLRPLTHGLVFPYGLGLVATNRQGHGLALARGFIFPQAMTVTAANRQPWPALVARGMIFPWQTPLAAHNRQPVHDIVSRGVGQVWTLAGTVVAACRHPFVLSRRVARHARVAHHILQRNPVRRKLTLSYRLSPPVAVIQDQHNMWLRRDGGALPVAGLFVEQRQGEPLWHGEAHLIPGMGLAHLPLQETLQLWIGTGHWSLWLAGKNIQRQEDRLVRARMTFQGPVQALDILQAPRITHRWSTAVPARQVAEEVLDQPVDWQLPDWTLAADILDVTHLPALALVQRLAEAAGGVLEAAPLGPLRVRPRYPVPVAQWDTATPDHVWNDSDHLLALQEEARFDVRLDQVTVRNRATPAPAPGLALMVDDRPGGLNFGHRQFTPGETAHLLLLQGPGLTVTPPQSTVGTLHRGAVENFLVTRDLFFDHRADALFPLPIQEVVDVAWQGTDLGPLTLQPDGRTLVAGQAGFAMARVTGRVQAQSYGLTLPGAFNAITTDVSVPCQASATLAPLAPGITVGRRGQGRHAKEVTDPLLTDQRALQSRAQAELDAGQTLRQFKLTTLFQPDAACGQLVEIQDDQFGRTWRGQIMAIRHEVKASQVVSHLVVHGR